MTGDQLRVGVIGCGGIANAHAKAYAATGRTRLVAVADILPDRAESFAERYGAERHHASAEDLLAGGDLDLISIATPPDSHAEIVEAVLAAGIDVVVEKPPCLSLAELDRMLAAEQASSASAYAIFQHRHGSGGRRARRLLGDGTLGRPQVAVCETLWFRPAAYFDLDWRGTWTGEGGGPTLGHGIHQFDLMLHLMGPWRTISALTARVARPVQFEDVSVASVVFESGAVGSVINSLLSPGELSRIRIDTTVGSLEVRHVYGYDDAGWTWTPKPDEVAAARLHQNPGSRPEKDDADDTSETSSPARAWAEAEEQGRASNHGAQLERLVDDLIAGRPHDCPLSDGRATMEFITAVYASGLTGRAVHRDELVPGHPFYDRLDGGLDLATIDATMRTDVSAR